MTVTTYGHLTHCTPIAPKLKPYNSPFGNTPGNRRGQLLCHVTCHWPSHVLWRQHASFDQQRSVLVQELLGSPQFFAELSILFHVLWEHVDCPVVANNREPSLGAVVAFRKADGQQPRQTLHAAVQRACALITENEKGFFSIVERKLPLSTIWANPGARKG